ncbi:hypothetical protein FB107DRAFT_269140 [Schizophyllum commune]
MSRQSTPAPRDSESPAPDGHSLEQPAETLQAGPQLTEPDYDSKCRDLKRKVEDIEAENDRLYLKVLHAKRNIQRMKLERAVLYERLTTIPPSPELRDRPLPVPPPPVISHDPPVPPPPLPPPSPQGRQALQKSFLAPVDDQWWYRIL